jgi:histidinol dehydrogenase
MNEIIDWCAQSALDQQRLLRRPRLEAQKNLPADVTAIIDQVRSEGDAALLAFTARFDRVVLQQLKVSEAEIAAAETQLAPELRQAIRAAYQRIRRFHAAGAPQAYAVETDSGVVCERVIRPLARAGLYVPAGSAPLPSTALMLGVPAQLAQCADIVLCSPPQADGSVHPAVLFAASLCGIRTIFKLGGVQAIAAMAYGTDSVPKCDKLFGPGNAYVTQAKQQVSMDPEGAAIDLPAGPSEVLVIADQHADAEVLAADLLSQAEHGADSQVLLLSDSSAILQATQAALARQLANLPRAELAGRALQSSRLILVRDLAQAFGISNQYAPEHLIVNAQNPRAYLDLVQHAGSIFLGPYTPESAGDYNSGTNHVLPTFGYARSYSGVSVASFVRLVTVQELTPAGLALIGPETVAMAQAEQLQAHANAVAIRLQRLTAQTPNAPAKQADIADVLALLRDEVRAMKAYSSARMEAKSQDAALVMLNANEAPNSEHGLHRYPDPQPQALLRAMAQQYGVAPEQLLLGRGSDEAIDLLTRAFCRARQDAIVIMPPTFGMYRVCADVQGARVIEAPLLFDEPARAAGKPFQVDWQGLHNALQQHAGIKLVYLCSPNNPTGNALDQQALRAFLQATAGRCVVVLDEAYQEYASTPSAIGMLAEFPHLAILRTLSKAYGLAGARLGALIAHAEIISSLRKIMPPYPVPSLVAQAALFALQGPDTLQQRVALVRQERERLENALAKIACVVRVYPSDANFLTFVCSDASALYQYLMAQRVIVRDVSHYRNLSNCLRVSIGSAAENDAFLAAVQRYDAQSAQAMGANAA